MKTIEERAYEYACKNDKPSSFFCDLEKSYKVGATEQKAIDEEELAEYKRQRDEYYDELCRLRQEKVELIDKACKWRCRNCNRCIADADKISRCPGLKMLRKAME